MISITLLSDVPHLWQQLIYLHLRPVRHWRVYTEGKSLAVLRTEDVVNKQLD